MNEPRTGTVVVRGTRFSIWEPAHFPNATGYRIDDAAMAVVFKRVLGRMVRRGWDVFRDPSIEEHHPILGPSRRRGRKGSLHMRAEVCGRCVEIEMFLDEVFVNSNGHEFDFDKARFMTPLQQLQTITELTSLVRKAQAMGYDLHEDLAHRARGRALPLVVRDMLHGTPIADPLVDFNRRFGHTDYERDDTGWPVASVYDRDGTSRDDQGHPVRNGQVRYARDYRTKRVVRGVAYTQMGRRWRLETGVGPLFLDRRDLSLEPPEPIGRFVSNQASRLEVELQRAAKARDFARVSALAEVLRRQVPLAAE